MFLFGDRGDGECRRGVGHIEREVSAAVELFAGLFRRQRALVAMVDRIDDDLSAEYLAAEIFDRHVDGFDRAGSGEGSIDPDHVGDERDLDRAAVSGASRGYGDRGRQQRQRERGWDDTRRLHQDLPLGN